MKTQLRKALLSIAARLRQRCLCLAGAMVAATAAIASPPVQKLDGTSPLLPQGSVLPSALTLDAEGFSGSVGVGGTAGTNYYDGNNVDGEKDLGLRVFPSRDSGYVYLVGIHDHSTLTENNDGFIVRLNADGSYDHSFHTNGKLLFSVPFQIEDVAFDPSGNFYFTGPYYDSTSTNPWFGVYCVDEDGVPCVGFGTNGLVHTYQNINFSHPICVPLHITYDLTGALFVTGVVNAATSGNNFDLLITKLNSTTGSLVTGFGNGGGRRYGFDHVTNGYDGPTALLRTYTNSPSGLDRLYITGKTQVNASGTDYDAFVMAVNPVNGALDTTFANTGVRVIFVDLGATNKQDEFDAIVATRDGNIALAGTSRNDDGYQELLLAKMQTNGSDVASFCGGGGHCINTIETLFGPLSHYEYPVAIAERKGSGDLVIGMTIHNDILGAGEPLQAAIELSPSGTDWRALQAIGYTSANPSPSSSATDLKIDDSNRVLLAGSRYWNSIGGDWDMTLARMIDTDTIFANGFDAH